MIWRFHGNLWRGWYHGLAVHTPRSTAGQCQWTNYLFRSQLGYLHEKGFGVEFCSAISKILFLLVSFSYVDDCDLIQSGKDPLTVARSMQRVIQQWGDLVEVTGRALASDKTNWYLVDCFWKRGKWIAADTQLEFALIAKTEENNFVLFNRLSCSTASEMLGIWMAPNA